MNNRTVSIVLGVTCAILVVAEMWLLAIVNYRKMTPIQRDVSFIAAGALPIIAWALGELARRRWKQPAESQRPPR